MRWGEVSADLGLDFVHASGSSGEKHLPESMGSGLAWLDYDGDGWLDLYLVQAGEFPPLGSAKAGNRLLRSREGRGFEDVTEAAGVGHRGYGQGVVTGDAVGDGDVDLVVTNYGPDTVLVNRGDGTVSPVELSDSNGWSSSAALADIDGDGDLDLYVTSYVDYEPEVAPVCLRRPPGQGRRYCDPSLFLGAADRLYVNDGTGTFTDETAKRVPSAPAGRGLGVIMVDLDGDLAPEIYVANDLTPNLLLVNDGRGLFRDSSLFSGAAVNREGRLEAGMGIAILDHDGDLDPDLAVTNFDVETNTLYENLGGASFRDISAASGLGPPSLNLLGFGLLALDLDLDGDEDLWVANGHIFSRPNRDNTTYAQPSQLLSNEGGHFSPVACSGAWSEALVARGAAAADFDHDGDVDVAIQQNGRPIRLFANQAEGGRFLGLDVIAGAGSRAVGVEITASSPGDQRRRWVTAGDSYQSASGHRRRFHYGAATVASRVDVIWRSGARVRLMDPPPDTYLRLPEPR